ncbi:MAG: amidohydrolase [Symploca sp. SIO1A3]|nr:amidohydrolase [Symploca sp. SIO1A3]
MTQNLGFDVIDGDGHVVETRQALSAFGFQGSTTALIDRMLAFDRASWGRFIRTCGENATENVNDRISDQELDEIDISVNYPTPLLGISDIPEIEASVYAAQAYNDWFYNTWTLPSLGKMVGAALVSLRDPIKAALEAERAIQNLSAVAVMIQPFVGNDLHLCDSSLDPLWSVCERLAKPIAIHGSRHTCPPKLTAQTFRSDARFYAISHIFQQQVAMGDMVLGGVLERFPRLKVVFLESGIGWMPHYIDRLDEAYKSFPGDGILSCKPSEYLLSGNCYFSCEPDEPHLAFYVQCLGEEQVIFASDYPHVDSKFPASVRMIIENSGLSNTALARVLGNNARDLYGL